MAETKVEKIEKTDAEWRAQLTPEQYHIVRRKGLSGLLLVRFTRIMTTGCITASLAGRSCSLPTPSLSRGAGGRAFIFRSTTRLSRRMRTIAWGCGGSRRPARGVERIWDMFFRMGRSLRGCGIASIRLRWILRRRSNAGELEGYPPPPNSVSKRLVFMRLSR